MDVENPPVTSSEGERICSKGRSADNGGNAMNGVMLMCRCVEDDEMHEWGEYERLSLPIPMPTDWE